MTDDKLEVELNDERQIRTVRDSLNGVRWATWRHNKRQHDSNHKHVGNNGTMADGHGQSQLDDRRHMTIRLKRRWTHKNEDGKIVAHANQGTWWQGKRLGKIEKTTEVQTKEKENGVMQSKLKVLSEDNIERNQN
ncbi:unnamed protein product [Citrullus colocynthis]|uniref:Uncharacterized protein n=1 Tax=Citrullus colocynthis TaxID=252529 RepID=A0ABP0Y8R4_9ROSI